MFFELAALAYLIDKLAGEFPCKHPVAWMGDFIAAFERRFYRDQILPGALLAVSLIALTLGIALAIDALCSLFPAWLALPLLALFASTGLAMKMLHDSVAGLLNSGDPRKALSYLVSRDTEQMSETDVYRAALETWAENLSDGVIAPLFYLLLFGLPGIAVYKAVNTMDSMIAYKTERYYRFGRTAAILDDIANYVPARLTALLIVLCANDKRQAWRCMLRDGGKLESPNAGYPIAAMAGALNIALGGDTSYHGRIKHKPVLGIAAEPIDKTTVTEALRFRTYFDSAMLTLMILGALLS